MSSFVDGAMIALSASMVGLVALGARASARRAGRDPRSATRLGGAIALGLALWLAIVTALAFSGVLADPSAKPPRWPMLPLAALVTSFLASRTALARTLAEHTPRWWPLAAQTFRVAVELLLLALYETGRAPQQVTFEGRNFDILVGLTAPIVAFLVARGRISMRLVAAWNVAGLLVLASTVATVATSAPGPLHRDWPGAPFTELTTWPILWLPALLVPLAVFFHIVSLRQCRDASTPPVSVR